MTTVCRDRLTSILKVRIRRLLVLLYHHHGQVYPMCSCLLLKLPLHETRRASVSTDYLATICSQANRARKGVTKLASIFAERRIAVIAKIKPFIVAVLVAHLAAPAYADTFGYTCQIEGRSLMLEIDDVKKTLRWRGKIYVIESELSLDECPKLGWRAKRAGEFIEFCTATQGYADFQEGSANIECKLKPASRGGPLPFPDGRYVADPDLCSLTMEQIYDKLGNGTEEQVRTIDGANLGGFAEKECTISRAKEARGKIHFEGRCEAEGDDVPLKGVWTRVAIDAFSVSGKTFELCKAPTR